MSRQQPRVLILLPGFETGASGVVVEDPDMIR